ncbi:MAG: copper homeostasis protein CutC [Polaribacter sp.]
MVFIREACVEGVHQAINAQKLGADRIELCSNLAVGGTTPSFETIDAVLKKMQIPVRVMIRPRGGNFVYSDSELTLMIHQIKTCKQLGVEGVVFGVLKENYTLNLEAIKKLLKIALPLKIVIHKAIDCTPDIYESLKKLESLDQYITILTSGKAATAEEGKQVLKELVNRASKKIEILVAGKISTLNIQKLHQYISAKAYHGKKIVGELNA